MHPINDNLIEFLEVIVNMSLECELSIITIYDKCGLRLTVGMLKTDNLLFGYPFIG